MAGAEMYMAAMDGIADERCCTKAVSSISITEFCTVFEGRVIEIPRIMKVVRRIENACLRLLRVTI
jgi:hypothetical protein